MGTSYSTLRTRLLSKLRDPDAQKWSDNTELYGLISNAEQWMAQWLGSLPGSGRFSVQDTITLSAGAETSAISSLSSAATKVFVAVRYMDILTNEASRQPMPVIAEGDENLWRGTALQGATVVPGYFIRNETFIFLPTSTSARTIYCTYQWVPLVKTAGTDTAETPTQYDDLLINRAAYDGLGNEGERERTFEEKYAVRISEIEDLECNRLNRGATTTVKNVSSRILFGG